MIFILSRKSGLELNVDKTEILRLNSDVKKTYEITYMGTNIKLDTVNNGNIRQEYALITAKEEITRVAQITINNLCDYNQEIIGNNIKEYNI